MAKFNFFLIIIDLDSPENCPRLVWLRSGEKPGTSLQNRFLTYSWIFNERFDWQQWF